MRTAGLAWIVFLALATPFSRAQSGNATVSASLVESSVDAGMPAEYHIDVTNGQLDRPPPAPRVDGLTITYTGHNQSRQYNFGNGFQMQQTTTLSYVYSIETSRPGHYTIPGQQIDLNGTVARALPVTLTVLNAAADGGAPAGQTLSTELIVPKKSAYVGESIPAEVRTYFGLSVRFNADPDPILSGEGFSAQKFTRPRLDTQVIEGTQVHVASYKTAITGVKTGNLSVGPVEVQPVVQVPRTRPRRQRFNDPFDDPFFANAVDALNMAPPKQIKLRSEAVNVEIKPLPPGKPVDFSGAIGTFKLEAEANPRKAQAGDPITVRLALSGQGNFDRISAPILSNERGLRTYPATSKFKADDEVNLSGVKFFDQVVIADGARTSLPPYHFSYLDPVTGKYAEVVTPPLPVEIVGGSAPAPAASVPLAPVVAAASPTPTPSPKAAEDILYVRADAGPLRNAADFAPLYLRRSFWMAQGVVCLGLFGFAVLGGPRARVRHEKARHVAQVNRQRAELERALKRDDAGRGEFYTAATQLARLKAANHGGQRGNSLSVAEICAAKGLAAGDAGPVVEIFRRYDELAYSGAQAAREIVPSEERRQVLATLETLDKR